MKYSFNIRKFNIEEQSPSLERERFILMKEISKKVDDVLRKYKITIGILARWIFSNASNVDPLFPHNGRNNHQLKKDIEGQGQGHLYPEILKELNLCNNFNNAIITLQGIIKSPSYQQSKNSPISLEIKGDWYTYSFITTDNNYSQLKPIHKNLYEKLKANYSGQSVNLNQMIVSLIIRYEALESGNQQLAVNPALYSRLARYGFAHELYASGLNSFCSSYCSLFPDIEKYFGSKGNFDDFKIISGKYFANPPFDEAVTKNMATKLINMMQMSTEYIAVFITLPAWDKFEALNLLVESGFMTLRHFVPKNQIKFFHYYENKYIDAVNTYFILLENKKTNLSGAIKNDLCSLFPSGKNKAGGGNGGGNAGGNGMIEEYPTSKKYFSTEDFITNTYYKKMITNKQNTSDNENEVERYRNDQNDHLVIKIKNAPSDIIINKNIKYSPLPPKYLRKIVEQFYSKRAKYDSKLLLSMHNRQGQEQESFSIYNNLSIALNLIFPEGLPAWPMNIMLVDLTYSCEHFDFIKKRLHECYTSFADFMTKTSMFQTFSLWWCINPRYLGINPPEFIDYFTKLHEEKLNFIFVSGNLDYHMTKSISFYTEQISYVLYLAQTYLVLSNQAPGGSFIFFFYSCDSSIFRQIIAILESSYSEIYLFNLFDGTNNSYIIGKNFIGISPINLDVIKTTVAELLQKYPDFGESFNIYSDDLRKVNHVVKHIFQNPKEISYLGKVFDISAVNVMRINRKINEFHDKKYS